MPLELLILPRTCVHLMFTPDAWENENRWVYSSSQSLSLFLNFTNKRRLCANQDHKHTLRSPVIGYLLLLRPHCTQTWVL